MLDLSDDVTLKEIRARYSKHNGYYYQPDADRMWRDARALLLMIEDLQHELRLARQHLDDCARWDAIQQEAASKRRADV